MMADEGRKANHNNSINKTNETNAILRYNLASRFGFGVEVNLKSLFSWLCSAICNNSLSQSFVSARQSSDGACRFQRGEPTREFIRPSDCR